MAPKLLVGVGVIIGFFLFVTLGAAKGLADLPGGDVPAVSTGVYEEEKAETENGGVYQELIQRETVTAPDFKQEEEDNKVKVKVKGIYVSGYSAGTPERFQKLLDLVETTELNAMVIDVKDATGYLTYNSDLEPVRRVGSSSKKVKDIAALAQTLREKGIYPIARLVVFKDPVLARARPDLAVKSRNGGIWKDYKGMAWVDPYSREVWDYNLSVAAEVAQMGFREIQFDYVRFPSDGPTENMVFSHNNGLAREEVIREFLAYAREKLAPYGVFLSADVFGLTCSAKDDLGIGQKLELVAAEVDYVSPMVYPSHYALGSYGLVDPDRSPYRTVYKSLSDAVYRLGDNSKMIRPWLQDFSLRHKYGPKEVREQIRATYDAGLEEWILWNPANRYTEEALGEETMTGS
ncbi:putative glycoside hydrolase [Calderihabitans maritimus]|uniref:DUF4015 domain-containing protein n=1 Tax=Calderihabitans maritimus TaxID=1246530 RepID=A0A1Z5HQQ2_9FIRM|nr:putative glycoside hydrolase [Calderihabitans maritimus]GAW91862.1 hypothetical protein STH1268 [Calderihabitans maritimus]